MKKLSKLLGLALSAAVVFGFSKFNSEVISVKAEDVTLNAGTGGSSAKINVGETEYDAIKVGAKSSGGAAVVTVPSGATQLSFYAASWKDSTDVTLTITPAEKVSSNTASVSNNAGIANNSPFTFSGEISNNYYFTFDLNDIIASTSLTITFNKRSVIWGASYTTNSGSQGGEDGGGGDSDVSSQLSNEISNKDTYFSLSYSYKKFDISQISTKYKLATKAEDIYDDATVIIVSKNGSNYYAMTNDNSTSKVLAPKSCTNDEILTNQSSDIEWNVKYVKESESVSHYELYNDGKAICYNGGDLYLDHATYAKKFNAYFDVENNKSYFGYTVNGSDRALFWSTRNATTPTYQFKFYVSSSIGAAASGTGSTYQDYADETYIYVKVKEFTNVDFSFRIGVDSLSGIVTNFSGNGVTNASLGVCVQQDARTPIVYSLNKASLTGTAANGNSINYVVISLGDVLNNPSRLTAQFTAKAYINYNGETYYGDNTHTHTYSVKSLVNEYLSKYNAGTLSLTSEQVSSLSMTKDIIDRLTVA